MHTASHEHRWAPRYDAWYSRAYRHWLDQGGQPVTDRCNFLKVVLFKAPAKALEQRLDRINDDRLDFFFKYIYIPLVVLFFLAGVGYALYKYPVARIALPVGIGIAAAAVVLFYATRYIYRWRLAQRGSYALMLKQAGTDTAFTVKARTRQIGEVGKHVADTAVLAKQAFAQMKRGTLLCPLLDFSDPRWNW